jgi:LPXTG-motif cell wall-anchored protein
MIKAIKVTVVLALVMFAVFGFMATAAVGAETNEGVCTGLTSGKIDVSGNVKTITVTADEGFLVSRYCVKAGSIKQGNGPEYFDVVPPKSSVTFGHSSGKDISHYSYAVVPTPSPSPTTPSPTATSPSPTPTETESESPTPTPTITTATPTPTESSATPTPSTSPTTESPTPTPTQTEASKSPDDVESASPSPSLPVISESEISTPVETVEPEPTPTITESDIPDELAKTGLETVYLFLAAAIALMFGAGLYSLSRRK